MGFLCETIIYPFTTKYYRSHYRVLKKRKIMNNNFNDSYDKIKCRKV